MSKRLENHLLNCFCGIIHGDRGCGKSTLFAQIVDIYLNEGYEVYCQYPYKGCKQIPLKEIRFKDYVRYDVDKDWLYSANLSHSCVLIDEARTVWPARGYAKWTQSDEDFFNFIRKNDTHVFMATQVYDGIDLNCRRASDYTYFMTSSIFHFSHIESSRTRVLKVADRNTEVVGRFANSAMRKVSYEVCEVPSGNFYFWRRPWYKKFISTHTFEDKPVKETPLWEDLIDFDEMQVKQGYIENSVIIGKIKDFLFKIRKEHEEIQESLKNGNFDEETDEVYFYDQLIVDEDEE